MKIALALIVKGSKEESQALDTCLSYVAKYVDGIFLTFTHTEGSAVDSACYTVAEKYKAFTNEFTWIYDFAAARNFNFNSVPKEYDYILWCDADDAFRGIEKLRSIIEQNPADAYVMNYLYSFDEHKQPVVVHMKTQIVKNDGCVTWQGNLHEDFKDNRTLKVFMIKDVERIHLSTEHRFDTAKERNLEVAQRQVEKDPHDPRAYWNLANSLFGVTRLDEAIETFEKFVEMSTSDEEIYIAYLRMAEAYAALGKRKKALDKVRYAIGLRFNYPDAYYVGGMLYAQARDWQTASEYYFTGVTKKKPYHSIIVYNPRDYDYNPLINLSKCYINLGRPDLALPVMEGALKIIPTNVELRQQIELVKAMVKQFDDVVALVKELEPIEDKDKIRAELAKIPQDLQAHPAICRLRNVKLVKEKSSGKDLVFFCGNTSEEWTPETAKTKGIGGSEEAVIWLSRLLVNRGWNVTVYNNCGYKEQVFDGVTYKPYYTFNPRDKQDIVVLWRNNFMLVDYEINADKIFVDLHDVPVPGDFTEERLAKIYKIFVKSKVHRNLLPHIPDEKFIIVPNGIDARLFTGKHKKDPKLVINTSSPDRSLSAYVKGAKLVKQRVPDAKFVWAYGFGVFDATHADSSEMMGWKDKIVADMQEAGIENLGRLGHKDVAELYKKATVFGYPSEFFEIDCISLSKAMAAGATPVTTDFAAMGEKAGHGGVFIHSDKTNETWLRPHQYDFSLEDDDKIQEWADAVVACLTQDNHVTAETEMRDWALQTFDWEHVADTWNENLLLNK